MEKAEKHVEAAHQAYAQNGVANVPVAEGILAVFRTLVNESQTAGRQSVVWDGRNTLGSKVSSGTYFCSLKVGNENLIRRMTILR